jgi:N6-adenosine-specific RNA methylase IME4
MSVLARVIVADPPWMYKDKLPGPKRGAAKHYPCMTLSEIIRTPLLPPLHDNCVLFLWRVSAMVEEAYQVVRGWGFVPKTELVWEKTDQAEEKIVSGMGHILRGSHETCIVARRGRPLDRESKGEQTVFRAPRPRQHSAKPEVFYQIVERLYPLELWPEAHVELFARRRRRGWIQVGDGLPGTWEHTLGAMAIDAEEAEEAKRADAPKPPPRQRGANGARMRP